MQIGFVRATILGGALPVPFGVLIVDARPPQGWFLRQKFQCLLFGGVTAVNARSDNASYTKVITFFEFRVNVPTLPLEMVVSINRQFLSPMLAALFQVPADLRMRGDGKQTGGQHDKRSSHLLSGDTFEPVRELLDSSK